MLPLSGIDLLDAHAINDHAEVCPVSRRVMSQPLSKPLQLGIRFLCDPLPALPTAHLTVQPATWAAIRAYHVPCRSHDWVRACLFAGDPVTTYPHSSERYPITHPFGSGLTAALACWRDDVYQQFTYVAHTSPSSASTRFCSEYLYQPSQPGTPIWGLHCQRGFTPHRYQ